MVLVKKLSRIGNSWGVILPTEVLKIAGVESDTEYEIKVDKKGILLRPLFKANKKDQRVMQAMARFIHKYRKDLKKLA